MATTILELLPEFLIGAEEADGDAGDNTPGDNDAADSTEGGSDSTPEGDEEGTEESGKETPAEAALRLALENERKVSRSREKELKAIKAQQAAKEREGMDEAELAKADLKAAQELAAANEAKAQKLAQGYLNRELKAAITAEAQKLNFIDVDDAIAGVDIEELVFTQDEDDPTQVEIDQVILAKAVKALATRKPHFINRGTDDGSATGSPLGGARKKKHDINYRELYPSL